MLDVYEKQSINLFQFASFYTMSYIIIFKYDATQIEVVPKIINICVVVQPINSTRTHLYMYV